MRLHVQFDYVARSRQYNELMCAPVCLHLEIAEKCMGPCIRGQERLWTLTYRDR